MYVSRAGDPDSAKAELDNQECRFLTNLWDVLHAGHYKMLSSSEWDAAMAEEFLLTLPVSVNWKSFDNGLLPRALWPSHPSEQAAAPEQLRDRVLVFHRGVDVARIKARITQSLCTITCRMKYSLIMCQYVSVR